MQENVWVQYFIQGNVSLQLINIYALIITLQ